MLSVLPLGCVWGLGVPGEVGSSTGLSYKVVEATLGHLEKDKGQTTKTGPSCYWGSSSRVATWRREMWMRWERGEQCNLGGPGCYILRDGARQGEGS